MRFLVALTPLAFVPVLALAPDGVAFAAGTTACLLASATWASAEMYRESADDYAAVNAALLGGVPMLNLANVRKVEDSTARLGSLAEEAIGVAENEFERHRVVAEFSMRMSAICVEAIDAVGRYDVREAERILEAMKDAKSFLDEHYPAVTS